MEHSAESNLTTQDTNSSRAPSSLPSPNLNLEALYKICLDMLENSDYGASQLCKTKIEQALVSEAIQAIQSAIEFTQSEEFFDKDIWNILKEKSFLITTPISETVGCIISAIRTPSVAHSSLVLAKKALIAANIDEFDEKEKIIKRKYLAQILDQKCIGFVRPSVADWWREHHTAQ
jgi:hypothetical protein